eukprot:1752182-Amphidinium_carterae.1
MAWDKTRAHGFCGIHRHSVALTKHALAYLATGNDTQMSHASRAPYVSAITKQCLKPKQRRKFCIPIPFKSFRRHAGAAGHHETE